MAYINYMGSDVTITDFLNSHVDKKIDIYNELKATSSKYPQYININNVKLFKYILGTDGYIHISTIVTDNYLLISKNNKERFEFYHNFIENVDIKNEFLSTYSNNFDEFIDKVLKYDHYLFLHFLIYCYSNSLEITVDNYLQLLEYDYTKYNEFITNIINNPNQFILPIVDFLDDEYIVMEYKPTYEITSIVYNLDVNYLNLCKDFNNIYPDYLFIGTENTVIDNTDNNLYYYRLYDSIFNPDTNLISYFRINDILYFLLKDNNTLPFDETFYLSKMSHMFKEVKII